MSGDTSNVPSGTYSTVIDYSTVIEEHPANKITLLVFKGSAGKPADLVTAVPVVSGYMLGHQWEPFGNGIYRFENGNLMYNVAEIVHWNLLGMQVYTQVKELQGTTALH